MPRILLAILLLLPTACAMPTVHESDHAAITGRTWVVTGASSGIGRGVAERAGSMGARVVLAARRAEALEEVARTIRASSLSELSAKSLILLLLAKTKKLAKSASYGLTP